MPFNDGQVAFPRACGAERIDYDGRTDPLNFAVAEDNRFAQHTQNIGPLSSMRAIRRYIAEAEIEIPAFAVQAN